MIYWLLHTYTSIVMIFYRVTNQMYNKGLIDIMNHLTSMKMSSKSTKNVMTTNHLYFVLSITDQELMFNLKA